MKKIIFPVLLATLVSMTSFAQDILYKKNRDEVRVKVMEIGVNEIKYKDFDNLDGPVMVIRKDEVLRIKYENGKETLIESDKYRTNQESAILDKTQAIKFQFFSPLNGHLGFAYERMFKVGLNGEFKVGVIGPGLQQRNLSYGAGKSSGVYAKAGTKFLLGQEFAMDGMRYSHPLKGKYISTEISFSSFLMKDVGNWSWFGNNTNTTDVSVNSVAVNIVFGKQWILGNAITMDWYMGFGYGYSDHNAKDSSVILDSWDLPNNYYSHVQFSNDVPLSFTGGMTVGYIF